MSQSKPRRVPEKLRDTAVPALVQFLRDEGLSDAEIERGLAYAAAKGAYTTLQAFTLAMSRARYSDEQLRAGMRFSFVEEDR